MLVCVSPRLVRLLCECGLLNMARFDSLVRAHRIGEHVERCLSSLPITVIHESTRSTLHQLHALSLLPLDILARNYQHFDSALYANINVLTSACTSAWQLHVVREAFDMSHLVLSGTTDATSYEQTDKLVTNVDESEEVDDASKNTTVVNNNSEDSRNFYRDFTLQVHSSRVNLTTLVLFVRLHSQAVSMLTRELEITADHVRVFLE